MSKVITLDETIEVQRPLHEVFAYVSDFYRIQEWDPAVASGHKLTAGAPAVGSQYQIDMKAGFSLYYKIIEFEPDQRMLMTVDARFFNALEEITFIAGDNSTQVRYIAKFNFPAALTAVNRAYPAAMDRIGKNAIAGLQQALEDNFEAPKPSKRLAMADRLILPALWRFTRLGYRNSRKRWNPVSAYLGGKHAVVTGATSGIGLAASRQLALMGARLTLVVRDQNKGLSVVHELKKQTDNPHINIEVADMGIMGDVRALADRLLTDGGAIDILVNNAGALFNPRQVSVEGLEKSFALLLLGPYILTERLHPLLTKSGSARVINVLSGGMYSQKIDVDDLQTSSGSYSGSAAYARAKRGLMIVTEFWAERWRDNGISVNAMHPGWADTPGMEDALPRFYCVAKRWLRTPHEGADTICWLSASSEAGTITGKFWLDREQQPCHILKRTEETLSERVKLLTLLAEWHDSNRSSIDRPSA